jgi:hypothetical protein
MSKISNDLAVAIGKKEAEKKYDPIIADLKNKFDAFILDEVKKKYPCPADVLKVLSGDNSSWIRRSNEVYISDLDTGTKESYRRQNTFVLTETLPISIHGSFVIPVTPKIQKLYDTHKKANEDKKAMARKIELAVKGIGTVKKVVDTFPEFAVHLKDKMAPVYAVVPVQTIQEIKKEIVRP